MSRICLAVALVAASAGAFAQTTNPIVAANNRTAFELGVSNLTYHEFDSRHQVGSEFLDSEHGNGAALETDWSRQGTLFGMNNIYTSVGLLTTVGALHYNGYKLTTGKPMQQTHPSSMLDLTMKLGKALPVTPSLQVTPYLGYVFHTWFRSGDETYLHHELGAGVLTQYAVTPKLVLGVDAMLARMLGPMVLTDGITPRPASRMTQTFALTGDYALSKTRHLVATYQYRHFGYGETGDYQGKYSGLQGTWFEPSSRTSENTVMVGMTMNF